MAAETKGVSKTVLIAAVVVVGLVAFGGTYSYFQANLNQVQEQLKASQASEAALAQANRDRDARISSLEEMLAEKNGELLQKDTLLKESEARAQELQGSLNAKIAELAVAEATLEATQTNVETLQSQVTDAQASLLTKEAELKSSQQQLTNAQESLKEAQDRVDDVRQKIGVLSDMRTRMNSDIQLLIELTEQPATREETLSYWNDLRTIAAKSDASLGTMVDRIIDRVDGYWDWVDSAPAADATLEEFATWFFFRPSVVDEYFEVQGEFVNEFYGIVATRMETVVGTVDELSE